MPFGPPRRRSRRRAPRRRPRSGGCPRRDRVPTTPAPVPAGCSVRPKSDSVKVVTCSSSPSSTRGVVEGLDRLAHLRQQVRLRGDLILVRVESSELTEEDLPVQPERRRDGVELDTLATCSSWLPSVVFGKTVASADIAAEASGRCLSACCVGAAGSRRPARCRCRSSAGAPWKCRRATSSAAVPKPLSTSTWLSAVGAGAIDSGLVVWPRVKMPPDSAVIVGKPDACAVEPIGGAAAPPALADAVGDRRSATARPGRSARRADRAAARRPDILHGSAAARAARRCRRPTASDRSTVLQRREAGMQSEAGCRCRRRDRQQCVARDGQPRRAAHALRRRCTRCGRSGRPCCCRRCRRPETRRPAPGSRRPARRR